MRRRFLGRCDALSSEGNESESPASPRRRLPLPRRCFFVLCFLCFLCLLFFLPFFFFFFDCFRSFARALPAPFPFPFPVGDFCEVLVVRTRRRFAASRRRVAARATASVAAGVPAATGTMPLGGTPPPPTPAVLEDADPARRRDGDTRDAAAAMPSPTPPMAGLADASICATRIWRMRPISSRDGESVGRRCRQAWMSSSTCRASSTVSASSRNGVLCSPLSTVTQSITAPPRVSTMGCAAVGATASAPVRRRAAAETPLA